jgi:hypothetical protein
MLRFIVYHGGVTKLIIFSPDGGEDPDGTLSGLTQWVPTSEVVRVEECLELSSPNPELLMHYELSCLFGWMEREIALAEMEDALRRAAAEDDEIMFVTPEEGGGREEGATAGDAVPRDTQDLLDALGAVEEASEEREDELRSERPSAGAGSAGPAPGPGSGPNEEGEGRRGRGDE